MSEGKTIKSKSGVAALLVAVAELEAEARDRETDEALTLACSIARGALEAVLEAPEPAEAEA